MKTLYTSALVLAIMFSPGCCTTEDIIREDYVAADRATYDAITPAYLEYVAADPTLDDDERERRERTVTTWNFRLEQAETPAQPADASEEE